jgi:transcriptional regulator GlxA family with amidase domain
MPPNARVRGVVVFRSASAMKCQTTISVFRAENYTKDYTDTMSFISVSKAICSSCALAATEKSHKIAAENRSLCVVLLLTATSTPQSKRSFVPKRRIPSKSIDLSLSYIRLGLDQFASGVSLFRVEQVGRLD